MLNRAQYLESSRCGSSVSLLGKFESLNMNPTLLWLQIFDDDTYLRDTFQRFQVIYVKNIAHSRHSICDSYN